MPANTVSVTRPGVFGNPFRVGPGIDAERAVGLYRKWLAGGMRLDVRSGLASQRSRLLARLPEIAGKDLACWCREDAEHCHADVLLELARGDIAGAWRDLAKARRALRGGK